MSEKIKMKRKHEKTVIIFYQVKRQSQNPITLNQYMRMWECNWPEDFKQFVDENGKCDYDKAETFFKPMFKIYFQKYGGLSNNELRGVRKEFTKKEAMPAQVYNLAAKRGYTIHKSYSKCMGVTLGGFCIFDSKNRVVAGKKFDLSYHEICEFLEIPQSEENRFLDNYKESLIKGNVPKGTKPKKKSKKTHNKNFQNKGGRKQWHPKKSSLEQKQPEQM